MKKENLVIKETCSSNEPTDTVLLVHNSTKKEENLVSRAFSM